MPTLPLISLWDWSSSVISLVFSFLVFKIELATSSQIYQAQVSMKSENDLLYALAPLLKAFSRHHNFPGIINPICRLLTQSPSLRSLTGGNQPSRTVHWLPCLEHASLLCTSPKQYVPRISGTLILEGRVFTDLMTSILNDTCSEIKDSKIVNVEHSWWRVVTGLCHGTFQLWLTVLIIFIYLDSHLQHLNAHHL